MVGFSVSQLVRRFLQTTGWTAKNRYPQSLRVNPTYLNHLCVWCLVRLLKKKLVRRFMVPTGGILMSLDGLPFSTDIHGMCDV